MSRSETAAQAHNGIALPDVWPPAAPSDSLATPPYLAAPPDVIPIDVGRQLFVDDFLIESTDLQRVHHRGDYHPASPVVVPDRAWEHPSAQAAEHAEDGETTPFAAPFSDGVWYDPEAGLYRMWYLAGPHPRETCYATSVDGLHWDKTDLDVVPGTNIVLPTDGNRRDSTTVWLDHDAADRGERFKLWQVMHYEEGMGDSRLSLYVSGDGVHWVKRARSQRRLWGERTTIFRNPFRDTWVYSLRNNNEGRHRDYSEDPDPVRGTSEIESRKTPWVFADDLDDRSLGIPCQLYNLDCIAYESLFIGLFAIWRGDPEGSDRPKINEVCVGYSRDGFHWTRPDRRPFCPVSREPTDWNWGNVQSVGGCCTVLGDRLRFYVSGYSNRQASTGLATLRRDGFASLNAGDAPGTLTTRPLRFGGRHLFANVDCPEGMLQAEALDSEGRVIAPYTLAQCQRVAADSTLQAITWTGADDLLRLSGQTVKFRFRLTRGRLYSFWVSPTLDGASHGFVAAGGPGLTGATDTLGLAAYPAAPRER